MLHFRAIGEFKLELQSGNAQYGSKSAIFVPWVLGIWRKTPKINWTHLLCCFKLCASFHSHQWIQTGVTVRKRPIWVKIEDILSRAALKFNGWHWKWIGHLYQAASSFVYHFIIICGFKLELQSGNAKFGSKSTIFRLGRPWSLGASFMLLQALCIVSKPLVNSNWNYSLETHDSDQNRQFLSRVTLKFDWWPWKSIRPLC